MKRKPRSGLPRLFDRPKYRKRNTIERMFGWLKENRRIVTRFQFFSARVKVNGEILTDYAVLNLLKSEEAFDLEGCVYVPLIKSMPDGPRKFKNIALQDKLSNAQIFRASEDRGSIIVSEKLAQIFTSATVKGVRFVSKLEGV